MFQVDATDPPWGFPGAIGPFRPFAPGMPPFPRMLGGDYDLHPEFAAGKLCGIFKVSFLCIIYKMVQKHLGDWPCLLSTLLS